jgi:hypothetical protein
MLNTITTRFFILDENCAYTEKLKQYNESIKLYAELVDKFCTEYNITKEAYKYRCDYRLSLKISKQEQGRLYKEYGSYYIHPGTTLGFYWIDFLKKNKARKKFVGYPKLQRFLPLKIYNFKSYCYEYNGHVYVAVDGSDIESMDFPEWCREITEEIFYYDFDTTHITNKIKQIN